MAEGPVKSDLWWLVLILLGLGLAWFVTGGPNNPEANSGVFLKPPAQLDNGNYYGNSGQNNISGQGTAGSNYAAYNNVGGNEIPVASQSSHFGQFSINTGNARYEFQPNREYITLNYRGTAPVNLTGWYLMNGKSDRVYDTGGGNLARLPSDAILIPRVVKLFRAGGNNTVTSDLIVSNNAQIVITTGAAPNSATFPISNFQTNLCSGYLDDLENVDFSPNLWSACPAPRDWPAASNIDNACYQFLSYLRSCHAPKFERKVDSVDYVDNQVNKLSSSCQNFVQNSFTYNGCVANFSSRPDFYQNEWRIFLGRPWELWANERETITLYDKNNKIVAQEKY